MKIKESKRVKRQKERSRNLIDLDDFCTDHMIDKEFLTPYQLRMTKDNTVVDAYPTSKKLCVIRLNGANYGIWGSYESTNDFLEYFRN